MKKVLILLASALVLSVSAKAEDFFPYWYAGLKGGAQYTAGEGPFSSLISPTAGINIGGQITRWFGARLDVSGWQAKGYQPLEGLGAYKFNYAQAALDLTFGYEFKVVNPYVFIGFGGARAFNNGEAQTMAAKRPDAPFEYLWDNMWTGVGRVGVGIDFNLGKVVALGLEFTDNMYSDRFNSKNGTYRPDFDYNLSAMLNLKFKFGSGAKKRAAEAAAAAAAAEAEAARLAAEKAAAEAAAKAAAEAEAARLAAEKAAAEKAAAEAAAAKAAAAKAAHDAELAAIGERSQDDLAERLAIEAEAENALCYENILFELNKSEIRVSEQDKINELAKTLKANPDAKVKITGYADRATGNRWINLRLSKERAKIVAAALVNEGIAKERLEVLWKGDRVNPFLTPEENRVDVCIVK